MKTKTTNRTTKLLLGFLICFLGFSSVQSFAQTMTYVSSTSAQPDLSRIPRGTTNNKILRIAVQTSATGSSANVTSFDLSTNGSATPSTTITNAKVWYTGSSPNFSTTTQFGSTSTAPSGTFTVSGTQALGNGLNYFWVSYDVPVTAAIGDSVDAEVSSLTFAGTAQTPTITAPPGARLIRGPYCASNATSTGDEEIFNVTFGSLNNSSTCATTAPGPGSLQNEYSNYTTTVSAPNILTGLATTFSLTRGTCGGFYGERIGVYIDYNQDGTFGAGETALLTASSTGSTGQVSSYLITVPCSALSGNTVMRVVYVETNAPTSCGTYTWGETEDYLVNIVNGAPTYTSAGTIQVTGVVAPGTNDVPILRVPVKVLASPCNPGLITEVRFNTTGTTNVANISTAKLYKTGSGSVFNTNNLLGSISSPSGQMVFSINDTANNDSNNYWLAYDVSSSASNGNVLDARVDSVQVFGNYYVPANNNPTGNRVIAPPMSYISSTSMHPDLSKVERPSTNNRLLRIFVRGSSTGSPINVTQFSLNTNGGGNDTVNISNAKLWYTGSSSTFAATTQFGSTYTVTSPTASTWPAYTIGGSQPLLNDTNYFWLTYDIKSTAIIGDSVDAEVTDITIGGTVQTPTVTAPAGNRKIRNPYCASAAYYSNYDDIGQVTMTQNSATVLDNGTGCTPALSNINAVNQYTNYTQVTPGNFLQNLPVSFNICDISGATFTVGAYLGIFIDYNQNGTFDAGELAFASTTSSTIGHSSTFTIPCTALSGNTRMRIIMQSYNPVTSACLAASFNYYYGETEDYVINIVNNPITYINSTAIQQTGPVSPGSTDAPILRVPVRALGCGVGVVSEMRFNIAGTTSASNITSAKLYKTGNSPAFTNTNLLAQVFAPTGQIVFTINDTLAGLQSDTNNYWLAYDISSSASTTSNFVDGRLDSINAIGAYRLPLNGNPTGNRQISSPMTYISSTAMHPDLSKVERPSTNNRLLRIFVRTSSTGSPISATQFSLNTNGGGNDTINIINAKLWYTGNSPTFAATSQFGSTYNVSSPTASTWPSYTISGTQPLLNDTNYFWLTYDIKSTAVLGDSVDAEVTDITIGGTVRIPTVTAPAGNRKIRLPYCASAAYYNSYDDIGQVTMTQNSATVLDNGTGCTPALSNVNATRQYTDYSALTPGNFLQNVPVSFNICDISGTTFIVGGYLGIFIDYNQNGTFDAGERAYASTTSVTTAHISSFTIPCTALTGNTRMRIIMQSYNPLTSACLAASFNYYYGETEDYTINIVGNPIAYINSTAIQQTGPVSPGSTDVPILRVPVRALGCGAGVVSEMRFNIAGTTSASNITSAKLYKTGNSPSFTNTNLLAQVFAPTGQIVFTINDTLAGLLTDTNNYWLAYDISSSASTTSNFVDGRLDSINAIGAYRLPLNGNPSGNRQISLPMTYISSTAMHPDLSKVERPSTNNRLLRIFVRTSSTGSPISATQFSLNTNGGGNDTANIINAKLWYTGNSPIFTATSQFGSTYNVSSPTASTWPSYTISGTQPLLNDTNYFWLTYDIKSIAVLGDSVDAEVTDMTIGGTVRIPTVTAPAGNRMIRLPYCASAAYYNSYDDIGQVTMTQGSATILDNGTGCTPAQSNVNANRQYTDYTQVTTGNFLQNVPVSFNICDISGTTFNVGGYLGIFIDYNQNGTFDAGERAYASASAVTTAHISSFTIPCTALPGYTRMRIIFQSYNPVTSACLAASFNYYYGETEDYTINIVGNPIAYVNSTAIQQTGFVGPGSIDVPILRVPVRALGCGVGVVSEMRFNITGTTSASNITSAKLYKTGNSPSFTNTNLLAQVFSPTGQIVFTINDTLAGLLTDTNNYWLAYDISSSASTTSNFVDGRLDSINAIGAYRLPLNGNPTGNRQISSPMTYISSTAMHPDLSKVERPSTNNRLLRILVRTSSTGSPISATQFSLNTNGGGNDTTNITNAKLWYTGSNPTFTAINQFGSTYTVTSPTASIWPSYTISGTQNLLNDTNYFWLTYDIRSTSIVGDSVDAEVTDMTIGGTVRTPTVTAPAGNRKIRLPFCASAAYYNSYDDIGQVTMTQGSTTVLDNGTGCTPAQSNSNAVNQYTNYTQVTPGNFLQNVSVGFNVCDISGTTFTIGAYLGIFIDYNQNGTFDAGELAYASPSSQTSVHSGSFTIPCSALPGNTRMRVIMQTYNPVTNACLAASFNYYYGETEDYTINIVANPIAYLSSTAVQQTGFTSPGSTDVPILRVPVTALGCGTSNGIVSDMRFNIAGTTSASTITSAKLYKTGNSTTFANTTLLSQVFAPTGQMVFTLNDTLSGLPGDTNNYWIAYDISSSASTTSNFVDARLDSINAIGAYRIPVVGNPTGNRQVVIPMTYISSTASHPDLNFAEQGSNNSRILLITVNTSATGAAINLTRFNLSTLGSASPSVNISNAKVWYTGASNTFNTSTQFGSTSPSPSGSFSVLGSQALLNGVNYFFVTYDIPTTANVGDSLNAVASSLIANGITQIPTVTAPAGNRKIRAPYCVPTYTAGCTVDDITNVVLVNLSNSSGCTGVYNLYDNVTVPTLYRGGTYALSITYGNDGTQYGLAWIDYNNDGVLSSSESLPVQTPANASNNGTSYVYFTVPLTANLGTLRLRLRGGDDVQPSTTQACGASNSTYGETEDYNINVDISPLITYVWTGTTSTDAAIPTNWNPARYYPNVSDKLMFNTGTTISPSNVSTTQVRAVELANTTLVNLLGTSGNTIFVSDSLILGTGSRVNTGTLNVSIGISTATVGTLTGAGRVTGNLIRWINSTNTSPVFPMADTAGINRNVTLNYTTLPTTYGSITSSFVSVAPGNTGLPITDASVVVKRAGINGYWSMTTTSAGGVYTGTFSGTGFKGVSSYTGLRLINRATSASSWNVDGVHVATTGSNAAPVLSRTAMSAYGQYAIGGDTLSNPLPVNLMFFNAKNVNGDVLLNWVTASETNNEGFMVERSTDGINFVEVGFVKGSGNTKTTTQYNKADLLAFAKARAATLYYRLRQIDFDGVFTYSTTAVVNEQDVLTDEVKVFPNPFVNNVGVKIEASSNSNVEVQLIDMQGRVISTDLFTVVAGSSPYHDLKNVSILANGIYFVKVSMGGVSKTIKVTKAN